MIIFIRIGLSFMKCIKNSAPYIGICLQIMIGKNIRPIDGKKTP